MVDCDEWGPIGEVTPEILERIRTRGGIESKDEPFKL